MIDLISKAFKERMNTAVSLSWSVFSNKVSNEVVAIYKEASMQLQYAYILQQFLPLITFDKNEYYSIELEKSVTVDEISRNIDLLFMGKCGDQLHTIAVEMKCYRAIAASGGKRGAENIFMKDVWFDIPLLERYVATEKANSGVSLVMTDHKKLVCPSVKRGTCWDYDISDNTIMQPQQFTTPIGSNKIDFGIKNSYSLRWIEMTLFWFMETTV